MATTAEEQVKTAQGQAGKGYAAAAKEAHAAGGAATYVVQPGDSLKSIARAAYGTATEDVVDALHRVNGGVIGSDPRRIEAGQVLTLPAGLVGQKEAS